MDSDVWQFQVECPKGSQFNSVASEDLPKTDEERSDLMIVILQKEWSVGFCIRKGNEWRLGDKVQDQSSKTPVQS